MRNQEEIREQIVLLLIEEINRVGFKNLVAEPENAVPMFVEQVADALTELIVDEIAFNRRY